MTFISHGLQSCRQDEGDGAGKSKTSWRKCWHLKKLFDTLHVQYDYIKDDQSYQGDKQGIFTRYIIDMED